MGGIPLIATDADVDDFVAAIGRVLVALERTPTAAA
jgi:hypothetical protein